jgi:hypothetical protein
MLIIVRAHRLEVREPELPANTPQGSGWHGVPASMQVDLDAATRFQVVPSPTPDIALLAHSEVPGQGYAFLIREANVAQRAVSS